MLFGVRPSYELIKLFGSLCFAHYRPKSKDKFASRSRKFIFVGYLYGKKEWKLYEMETYEIFLSQDAMFHECIFPFSLNHNGDQNPENFSQASPNLGIHDGLANLSDGNLSS